MEEKLGLISARPNLNMGSAELDEHGRLLVHAVSYHPGEKFECACPTVSKVKRDDSICGIVIMFLELFAAYMFSAQGLRYKNEVVALLYSILDFNLGNYLIVALDIVNCVVSAITLIKHRKEEIIDRDGMKEYFELIKVTREARMLKKEMREKDQ